MVNNKIKGTLTREQFLFYETKSVAQEYLNTHDVEMTIKNVTDNNLIQKPTERMVKNIATVCMRRLQFLNEELIEIVANGSTDIAKQALVYSIAKDNNLFEKFMLDVIADKYRLLDLSFDMKDIRVFFNHLKETNEDVETWSDGTITRIMSTIKNILVHAGYLDDNNSNNLNYVYVYDEVKECMINNGDGYLLGMFKEM